MKRKISILLVIAALALGAFASLATATWNGLTFPRNGSYFATPGTYFDTPEWVNAEQTAGPCSNLRTQLRRADTGAIIWTAPVAAAGCPLGHLIAWQAFGVAPNYPNGVRIWIVGGPADGTLIGAYVCGGQGSNTGC